MVKEVKKVNKQKDLNKNISIDLLNSYRNALYKVQQYFDSIRDMEFTADNIDQNMKIIKSILDSGASLGKNMESLSLLEKKVQSEEAVNSKVRGNNKLGLFEDVQ